MGRWMVCLGLLLLLVRGVAAEPVTWNYTEPPATGTLAYTTIYTCLGAGCTDWRTETRLRISSDDGNGLDVKAIPDTVPLVQGTLPVTVRMKVTATDTSGNETSGIIVSHTFTE